MTNAPGIKKNSTTITQRLIEEVPLCPAAAIQRGPRTVAMLKRRTSQNPIVLRSCDFGSAGCAEGALKASRPVRESAHLAYGNCEGMGRGNFQTLSRRKIRSPFPPEGRQYCRRAF